MELGGLWWTNVLDSAVSSQSHRPDAQPEHQDPVIHMAQNKGGKERNERKKGRKKGRKERKEGRKKEKKVIKMKNNY